MNFTISSPTNSTIPSSVPKWTEWAKLTEFPLAEYLSVVRVAAVTDRSEFGTLYRHYDGASCYTRCRDDVRSTNKINGRSLCQASSSSSSSFSHPHSKCMISQRNELIAVNSATLRLQALVHPSSYRKSEQNKTPVELFLVLRAVFRISRQLIQDCFNFVETWPHQQQQQQRQQPENNALNLPSFEQYLSHYESYIGSHCAIMNSCLPRFPDLCLFDSHNDMDSTNGDYDDQIDFKNALAINRNRKKHREVLLRHMLSLYVQESIFPFVLRLFSASPREVKPLNFWVPNVIYNKTDSYTVPDGTSIDSRLLITQRTPEEYPSITFTCVHFGKVFNGRASSCLSEAETDSSSRASVNTDNDINISTTNTASTTTVTNVKTMSSTTIRGYWVQRFLFSITPGSEYELSVVRDNVDGAHAMGSATLQCFSIDTVHYRNYLDNDNDNDNDNSSGRRRRSNNNSSRSSIGESVSSPVEHCVRLKGV